MRGTQPGTLVSSIPLLTRAPHRARIGVTPLAYGCLRALRGAARPLRICLLITFLLAFFPLGAFPQRALVLVTEVWAPYRIVDDSGALSGIDVEIVHALERKLGMTIEIKLYPWSRCIRLMQSGDADLMSGIAWSDERSTFIWYLRPSYNQARPIFYARTGMGASIASYNDLSGKRIGQSPDTVYFDPYDSDSALTKITLTDEGQILRLLSLGRIDVAVGTSPNIEWDIKRLGYSGAFERAAYEPPIVTDLFFGVSKKSSAMSLADDLERALGELAAEGAIEGIIKKYQ